MSKELREGDKTNFDTLLAAARDNRLCLFSSTHKPTGEQVALLCVVNFSINQDGNEPEFEMLPIAVMFDGKFEDYESVEESMEEAILEADTPAPPPTPSTVTVTDKVERPIKHVVG